MLCRWYLGWSCLFKKEEGHVQLSVHYFSKTHGILRMRSEFRKTRNKLYGWEQSSSILHMGSEVIQSLPNECFYIFSVKIFILLQYHFKKMIPGSNWSIIHPQVQIAFDKRASIIICFLLLDSTRYLYLPNYITFSPFVLSKDISLWSNQKSHD